MAKGMSAGDRAMRSVLILLIAGAATPAMAAPGGRAEPAVETAIRDGAEAWEAGNFARALALWRPLAAAGNADAQYNLAQAYRLGRGVATDPAQARGWYLKAAEQGHAEAQANYGLMRFHAGERKDALPWLNKAAERGDARAQYVVGTALFNGDVAGKDWVRAYAMMTRAAAAGLPQAIKSLSEMDRFVPMDQRRQGMALARDIERGAMLETAGAAPAGTLVRAATAGASRPAARPGRMPTAPSDAAPPSRVRPVRAVPAATAATMPPRAQPSAAPARAVPVASVAPGAGGAWRVQVGAYSTAAAATAAWEGIARRVPGLVLRPQQVTAGAVTRLQAGPLASRADAGRACARITAATGAPCFPVPAP